jgi:predicted enzyme related to lactoylglutathione lyase
MLKPLLIAATIAASVNGTMAEPLGVERFGLYVLADDMDRATAFYASLFGAEPAFRMPALVGFDIRAGLFAIVSRETYAQGVPAGGSVRPYIRVSNLEYAFRRVQALAPDGLETEGIVREGAFRFFRFKDTEDNVIELFSLETTGHE